jgi:hypothetical protein
MNGHTGRELVISVGDVGELFAAPAIDPFSPHDSRIVGEYGLQRVGRNLLAWTGPVPERLVVLAPPEEFRPDLREELAAAVQRYCSVRVADNELRLRLMRAQGVRWLVRGALVLAVCIGVSSLFRNEAFPMLPPFLNAALGEGFNVIGWVMLWKPFEAFVFDPVPIKRENLVLGLLSRLDVEVRPQ